MTVAEFETATLERLRSFVVEADTAPRDRRREILATLEIVGTWIAIARNKLLAQPRERDV